MAIEHDPRVQQFEYMEIERDPRIQQFKDMDRVDLALWLEDNEVLYEFCMI